MSKGLHDKQQRAHCISDSVWSSSQPMNLNTMIQCCVNAMPSDVFARADQDAYMIMDVLAAKRHEIGDLIPENA